MTNTALKMHEIETHERVEHGKRLSEEKDREQREKASKRQARASIIGSAIGGGSKVVSGLSKAFANDPSIYKNYALDITKFITWPSANNPNSPFPVTELPVDSNRYNALSTLTLGNYLPNGIYRIVFADTVGPQNGSNSGNFPINNSLSRICTVIAAKTGRAFNYDPGDVGLYLYAEMYPFLMLERIKVAFKIAATYDGINMYYGDALLKAMGFDPVDFRTNKAQYLQLMSDMGAKVNESLLLPADFALFKRKLHMYTLIYRKGTSQQSPIYVAVPREFRWLDNSTAILAAYTGLNFGTGYTYSLVRVYLENAIQRIVDASGWKAMIADLRNAFEIGGVRKYQFTMQDVNDKFTFIADNYAEMMVRNLVTLPHMTAGDVSDPFGNIRSNAQGYLQQNSSIDPDATVPGNINYLFNCGKYESSPSYAQTVADSYARRSGMANDYIHILETNDSPLTGDEVLEFTRLMPIFDTAEAYHYSDGWMPRLFVFSCGTEVVTHIQRLIGWTGTTFQHINYYGTLTVTDNDYTGYPSHTLYTILGVNVAGHPNVIEHNLYYGQTWSMGRSRNPITFSTTQLSQVHDICTKSLMFLNINVKAGR